MSERRLGAVGGLVFAACSVAGGVLLPQPPDADASAPTVQAYFADHRTALLAVSVLSAVGALGLLPFLPAVRERLAGLGADLFVLAGGVLVGFGVLGALLLSAVAQESARVSGQALLAMATIESHAFFVGPPLLTSVVVGAVAMSGRTLPTWLWAFGVVVGVLGLIGAIAQMASDTASIGAAGLVGFLLTVVWIASLSVVTLRPAASTRLSPALSTQ